MPHPFRCDVTPHREASGAVRLLTLHNAVTPGNWHVVNDPLLHVVLMDTVVQKMQFLHITFPGITFPWRCVVTIAEKLTLIHCSGKIDLERRVKGEFGGWVNGVVERVNERGVR